MVFNLSPVISAHIIAEGSSLAGQDYSLTCVVSVHNVTIGTPIVQWMKSGSNSTLDVQTSMETSGLEINATLHFSPLLTSDGGQYVCEARIESEDSDAEQTSHAEHSLDVISE